MQALRNANKICSALRNEVYREPDQFANLEHILFQFQWKKNLHFLGRWKSLTWSGIYLIPKSDVKLWPCMSPGPYITDLIFSHPSSNLASYNYCASLERFGHWRLTCFPSPGVPTVSVLLLFWKFIFSCFSILNPMFLPV